MRLVVEAEAVLVEVNMWLRVCVWTGPAACVRCSSGDGSDDGGGSAGQGEDDGDTARYRRRLLRRHLLRRHLLAF